MFLLRYYQPIMLCLIFLSGILLHGFAIDITHAVEALREKSPQLKVEPKLGPHEDSRINLSNCNYDKDDFKKIIKSSTKAMEFFERHVENLVIDAAIGTRILQAQLALAQAGHPRLPSAVQLYLMTLQFKSELLSDEIVDKFLNLLMANKISSQQRKSLNDQLPWAENASLWESPKIGGWKSFSSLESFETLNITITDMKDEVLAEDVSDNCIGMLFQNCFVTNECSQLFMQKPNSLYSLTHQVIFFLIADKRGCFSDKEFQSKTSQHDPAKFVETLCGSVWVEANSIEASGYPLHFRDLLAEQVAVCASAGYPNFLKRAWLEKILSWQSTDASLGCFVDSDHDSESNNTKDEKTEKRFSDEDSLNYENIHDQLAKLQRWDEEYGNQRVKRSDEVLRIGSEKCSVHFTAVCLGSLAMHLRYFIDTCLRTY